MKMSELIKQLQAIDSSVPFDAEVVTEDSQSIYPAALLSVSHEPPHTILTFDHHDNNVED